ncbi:MAG TPA: glycosyltransferase family 87 protein [Planctomycetaceae bacterium]|nr:glycosyltransferase family 87 protein [Planctomycetaceae bacterium]
MARDTLLFPRNTLSRHVWADRAAWMAWAALFATISILILAGSDHSVVSTYRDATIQWFAGRNIYTDTGHGFLYLPAAAILFAPFAWLPPAACEIAWRLMVIGGFAIGVRRLGKLAEGGQSDSTFALLTLAALPPALACARNGQSTLIMAGLMMSACVDLAEGRRGRAVLCATLAVALKPLAVVLLLLAPFIDRRLAWRAALGFVAILCLPFVTQQPAFVIDQYVKCAQMFRASSHCGMIELWAQPFSVLGLLGINVSESTQTAIRLIAAGGAIGLCLAARSRTRSTRAVEYLLAISVLYILLFNPRTENNTYAMLGPVIGLSLVAALVLKPPSRAAVLFLSTLVTLMAVGDALVRLFVPEGEHIWMTPCLAVLFSVYLIHRLFFREGRRPTLPPAETDVPGSESLRGPHLAKRGSTAGVR